MKERITNEISLSYEAQTTAEKFQILNNLEQRALQAVEAFESWRGKMIADGHLSEELIEQVSGQLELEVESE